MGEISYNDNYCLRNSYLAHTMIQRILTIYPNLENLISSFEDQRIDSQDLAFFLATHGYDASHKKNYIELKLNNLIYKLAPNGEMPGLSDIIILDLPRRNTMKRSKQEIIAQILEVCLESASKTRIVYQVNLNFRTVNPYLEILMKNNLIEVGKGEQTLYNTTQKGADLLETIKKVNESLSKD